MKPLNENPGFCEWNDGGGFLTFHLDNTNIVLTTDENKYIKRCGPRDYPNEDTMSNSILIEIADDSDFSDLITIWLKEY